jgi:hypothetical protein
MFKYIVCLKYAKASGLGAAVVHLSREHLCLSGQRQSMPMIRCGRQLGAICSGLGAGVSHLSGDVCHLSPCRSRGTSLFGVSHRGRIKPFGRQLRRHRLRLRSRVSHLSPDVCHLSPCQDRLGLRSGVSHLSPLADSLGAIASGLGAGCRI